MTPDVEPAVTLVINAMTDSLHESLCNCGAYPDDCVSNSDYRRDMLSANLTYAEAALEEALKQGWQPPGSGETSEGIEMMTLEQLRRHQS